MAKDISLKDTETLSVCKDLFSESNTYRQPFKEKTDIYNQYYNGKQWESDKQDEARKRKPYKNFIFTTIEGITPILIDALPSADFIANNEEEEDQAKVLESAVHYVFDRQCLTMKQPQMARTSLIRGNGYLYVDYDPDGNFGEGEITIRNLPWNSLLIDGNAKMIDEANHCFIVIPMRIQEIERKFPHAKGKIKPEQIRKEFMSDATQFGTDANTTRYDAFSSQQSSTKFRDMAHYYECWRRDYTLVKIKEEETLEELQREHDEILQGVAPDIGKWEDHPSHMEAHALDLGVFNEQMELNPEIAQDPDFQIQRQMLIDHMDAHKEFMKVNKKGLKPKYTNFWRLTIYAGEVVLYDGEPDVKDGKIPVAVMHGYKNEDTFYATGAVENLISVQDSFNEMDYKELQGLRLNVNSGWVKDNNSGVDDDDLSNQEGIIVTKNPNSEVTRLSGNPVSPVFTQRKSSDRSYIDDISGFSEATQGRKPGGVTAAKAIERLQAQSVGRIRLMSMQLETYTMVRLAELVASRVVKYWNSERVLRVYNKSGKLEYIEFDPKTIKNLSYEVRVVPGTLAPTDKEAIFELMTGLFQQQLISPKAYIESVDIPKKAAILNDLEETSEMTQQLEALAAENEELKQLLNQGGEIPVEPGAPLPQ